MKENNHLAKVTLLFIFFVLIIVNGTNAQNVASNTSGNSKIFLPIVDNNYNPGLEYVSDHIKAATGGSITIGQSTLSIPPGALSQDSTITLSRPKNLNDVGERGASYLKLEPSGLSFNNPATLSINYTEPVDYEENWLSAYTYNETNESWEKLSIVSHDTVNNELIVQVNHFSIITHIFDRPLDLIFNIPGKYLLKGDLIFTLATIEKSTKFTWFPGHAGLYLGTTNPQADPYEPGSNDGQKIIESVPGNFRQVLGCRKGGVRLSTLSTYVNSSNHLYMGARRLTGISNEDRVNIASYALSKLTKGYSYVGEGNILDNCFSCAGLVEASYDHAGRSMIPPFAEILFPILPIEQYIRTEPVNEIIVKADEHMVFDAKRVYWNTNQDQYVSDASVNISNCPAGATCSNGQVSWTPTNQDVGFHTVNFTTSATINGKSYSASQSMTIQVEGVYGALSLTCSVTDAHDWPGVSYLYVNGSVTKPAPKGGINLTAFETGRSGPILLLQVGSLLVQIAEGDYSGTWPLGNGVPVQCQTKFQCTTTYRLSVPQYAPWDGIMMECNF